MDLQLHGIQDGLLAHGLHNAAGAQDGKPAFHPDVGVKGAFGGFLAPLDRDHYVKAAVIPGCFGLRVQGIGDHPARHMVDGRLPHRLVQAGLRHTAHTGAAINRDLAGGHPAAG